ncbi:MAG: hypothetical protein WAM14_21500 [Candidatus Nitrosopolaris sp.]
MMEFGIEAGDIDIDASVEDHGQAMEADHNLVTSRSGVRCIARGSYRYHELEL